MSVEQKNKQTTAVESTMIWRDDFFSELNYQPPTEYSVNANVNHFRKRHIIVKAISTYTYSLSDIERKQTVKQLPICMTIN